MTRFIPRWPLAFAKPSRSTLVATGCAAVALLSFVALVAYDSPSYTAFWR